MKETERIVSMLSKSTLALLVFLVLAALGMMPSGKAFAANLLNNPYLEEPYQPVQSYASGVTGSIAQDWKDNSYGSVGVNYSENGYVGGSGQVMDITSTGATDSRIQFVHPVTLDQGHYYKVTVSLGATSTCTGSTCPATIPVTLALFDSAGPLYSTYGQNNVNVTIGAGGWANYTVTGCIDNPYSNGSVQALFAIIPQAGAAGNTLYVRSADMEDYNSGPSEIVPDPNPGVDDYGQILQTAIDNIRLQYQNITTLLIPTGAHLIKTPVTINQGIQMIGAVDASGYPATQLYTPTTSPYTQNIFVVNNDNVKISNIQFSGLPMTNTTWPDYAIVVQGVNGPNDTNGVKGFCIQNCWFTDFGQEGVGVYGDDSRGVISNCKFENIFRSGLTSFGYGVFVQGGIRNWTSKPLELGTRNSVFVEHSVFDQNKHAIASNGGARYVFRDNSVTNSMLYPHGHSIDAHGWEWSSICGTRSFEIYNNQVWSQQKWRQYAGIDIRGGDGVIFNNQVFNAIYPILVSDRSPQDPRPANPPAQYAPDINQTTQLYVWDNNYSAVIEPPLEPGDGDDYWFPAGMYSFNVASAPSWYTPFIDPYPLANPY